MTIRVFWFTHPKDNKYDAYQFSNQEIQKNFLVEFGKYDEVTWHDCNARGRVTSDPNDILVGHPPWPPPKGSPYESWAFDNGLDGPGSMHPNTFIVLPWGPASRSHPAVDPYLPMLFGSRAFFGMGGTVHYDHNILHAAEDTGWRRAQHKYVRINMGCDARFIPFKDASFPRTTGLLHVSSLMKYKRPELMFGSLPREGCTLFLGTKRADIVAQLARENLIPGNVRILGPIANDNPAVNQFILKECSYYLHCAREQQATAILENAARGLVPFVTRLSGFACPDVIYLTEDDPEENRRIVAAGLAMPDGEYRERGQAVRRHVRMYHAWDRICQQMYVAMRALMAGQDAPRRGDEYS